jgi:hypothetical protein
VRRLEGPIACDPWIAQCRTIFDSAGRIGISSLVGAEEGREAPENSKVMYVVQEQANRRKLAELHMVAADVARDKMADLYSSIRPDTNGDFKSSTYQGSAAGHTAVDHTSVAVVDHTAVDHAAVGHTAVGHTAVAAVDYIVVVAAVHIAEAFSPRPQAMPSTHRTPWSASSKRT